MYLRYENYAEWLLSKCSSIIEFYITQFFITNKYMKDYFNVIIQCGTNLGYISSIVLHVTLNIG